MPDTFTVIRQQLRFDLIEEQQKLFCLKSILIPRIVSYHNVSLCIMKKSGILPNSLLSQG